MTASLKELFCLVRLELRLNKGFRMRSVVALFRIASFAVNGQSSIRYVFYPMLFIYKIYTEFLLGIELPAGTSIGNGLRLYHGVGLVVHKGAVIGSNCILRQAVTIGNKGEGEQAKLLPVIGNNVEFGAGAIVIGNVKVGDNSIIGAGAVVIRDAPPNSLVVGPASRVLERKS